MSPSERLDVRRQLLIGDGCELWALSRIIDRQRYGLAAATHLSLLNTRTVPLHLRAIEVNWSPPGLFRWERPEVIGPRSSWTLLDEGSFGLLSSLTRRKGLRGFGMEGVLHEVIVHLDQPEVQQLAFQVAWGFATPSYDMGFFLPALEEGVRAQ